MSDSMLNLIPRMMMDKSNSIIGWRGTAKITSNEFIRRVSDWRKLVEQLPGQNYALYLEDSLEFSAALFGAWHAGKTIWLTADTLTSTNEALKPTVDGFLGDFPVDCSSIKPSNEITEIEVEYEPLDNQFIGLVVHTSGTTGVAQAIPKKMSQLAIEVATLEKLFGEKSANAEIISTVTHQHIYGLIFKVLWPLTNGRAIHARSQLFPEELAPLIASRSCILISSPAHLKRLPTHLNWTGHSLCAVFSAGGVLTSEVAQSITALLGQSPIEIFGSSETGGIAWRQHGTEDESWIPMPDVQCRISSGEELIEVRSPHLMTEEWLQLADRGQAQKNGRFLLKGRRDRIVKIEEKRISLDLIEQRLTTSSFISEVKIIAFDEQAERQYTAAVIVLSESGKAFFDKEGKFALNQQLKNMLNDFIEPVAMPRRWRYVDQFPLNMLGKTTQTLLLELFRKAEEHKTLEPIVKLLHRDETCVEFELIWPFNLHYFEGHFPESPILAGVVQVDWAVKTGRQYFELPKQFRAMHALKFKHVILPENQVNLKLNYDQKKGCLNFAYFSPTKQHSSGRVLFSE